MELYSKTTRFALACNASDKIIGSLFLWKDLRGISLRWRTHSISLRDVTLFETEWRTVTQTSDGDRQDWKGFLHVRRSRSDHLHCSRRYATSTCDSNVQPMFLHRWNILGDQQSSVDGVRLRSCNERERLQSVWWASSNSHSWYDWKVFEMRIRRSVQSDESSLATGSVRRTDVKIMMVIFLRLHGWRYSFGDNASDENVSNEWIYAVGIHSCKWRRSSLVFVLETNSCRLGNRSNVHAC